MDSVGDKSLLYQIIIMPWTLNYQWKVRLNYGEVIGEFAAFDGSRDKGFIFPCYQPPVPCFVYLYLCMCICLLVFVCVFMFLCICSCVLAAFDRRRRIYIS